MAETEAPIEAVLFDLDGVVTDTARAHAAAWKRLFDEYLGERAGARDEAFEPFDIDRDYRGLVDGKPRLDGVRGFLESRGIALPEGSADDLPGAETVRALGNRKQRYFEAWLEANPVPTYPGTLALLEKLRGEGIRTALFSSSRNAATVLASAGLSGLFEVTVDGKDLAELGIAGKPDPAMLVEAARRLGSVPERCAVIEDAVSGVEAGRRGGFRQVVGIARNASTERLGKAGADLVARDCAELSFADRRLGLKTLANLPAAWEHEDELLSRLDVGEPVVFLDYDGTLTPIVSDHRKALLSDDMRSAVGALAERRRVAIVSGRDLEMLRRLVALDTVYLAGSHGFEILGPNGSQDSLEMGTEFLPELDEVESELRKRLAPIEGSSVERKRFSVAVHYRNVAEADIGAVDDVVGEVLASHPRLVRGHGKKVFELQPAIDWHKGRAVEWLIEKIAPEGRDVVPVYVGDDITDEDAFRALAGRGLTLVVRDVEPRATAADYALADTDDVRRFLEFLAGQAAGGRPSR